MAIQKHLTTLRLDTTTNAMLKDLVSDLNFNKSQIIRHSLRLFNELHEMKKQGREFLVRSEKGEEKLILLG